MSCTEASLQRMGERRDMDARVTDISREDGRVRVRAILPTGHDFDETYTLDEFRQEIQQSAIDAPADLCGERVRFTGEALAFPKAESTAVGRLAERLSASLNRGTSVHGAEGESCEKTVEPEPETLSPVEEAKRQYVTGEIGIPELERRLESALDSPTDTLLDPVAPEYYAPDAELATGEA